MLAAARRHAGAKLGLDTASLEGRITGERAFPISIDYAALAASPEVAALAQRPSRWIGERRRILLGVERLDSTQGTDVRLCATDLWLATKRLSTQNAVNPDRAS